MKRHTKCCFKSHEDYLILNKSFNWIKEHSSKELKQAITDIVDVRHTSNQTGSMKKNYNYQLVKLREFLINNEPCVYLKRDIFTCSTLYRLLCASFQPIYKAEARFIGRNMIYNNWVQGTQEPILKLSKSNNPTPLTKEPEVQMETIVIPSFNVLNDKQQQYMDLKELGFTHHQIMYML